VKDDFLIARKQIECFLHSKISKHRFFVGSSTYSLHLVYAHLKQGPISGEIASPKTYKRNVVHLYLYNSKNITYDIGLRPFAVHCDVTVMW